MKPHPTCPRARRSPFAKIRLGILRCVLPAALLAVGPASGAAPSTAPPAASAPAPATGPAAPPCSTFDFLRPWAEVAIAFHRRVLSPVDGHRCRMRPTCSRYGLEAIRRHGPLGGAWRTVDRLNRCGHDLELYPLRGEGDERGYHDHP